MRCHAAGMAGNAPSLPSPGLVLTEAPPPHDRSATQAECHAWSSARGSVFWSAGEFWRPATTMTALNGNFRLQYGVD